MAVIVFRVKGNGLFNLTKDIRELTKGGRFKQVQKGITYAFAQFAAKLVRKEYKQASYPISNNPDGMSTRKRYLRPPRMGTSARSTTPATQDIRRYTGTKPLRRSGQLAKSVRVSAGSGSEYIVHIDPNAVYPDGRALVDVADKLERGGMLRISVTAAVLRYFHAVQDERGKSKKRTTGRLHQGQTLLIELQPRPIWKLAYETMPKYRSELNQIIVNMIKTGRTKIPEP